MRTHLPTSFLQSLIKLDHFNRETFLSVHESGEQVVSVHMNLEKPLLKLDSWPLDFPDPPFEISAAIPWAPDAYYLSSRPAFTLDPFFHAGAYYVQEASGLFLSFAFKQVMDLTQKLRVLDLCAAPGGKSTLLQSILNPDSLLVSNEVIKTRVPVLCQNITKWGRANGIVSNNDPVHFRKLPGFFDCIVIDAPCSGSGLFRKDPDAAASWSPDLVRLCSHRQQRIIADAWDSLKDGGFLIYSTCSYSKEENEDILDIIFRQYDCISIPLSPDPAWKIVETRSDESNALGYRFYPDRLQGEGFFISVLQKKQAVTTVRSKKISRHPFRLSKAVEKQLGGEWLEESSLSFIPVGESVHALQGGLIHDFEVLKNVLYLKKAGIRVGKAGEHDWVPDHELALANFLKKDLPSLELDKRDVLHYLRGEIFEMEVREKGWRIVRFGGLGMGWVKLLDKRFNNYYPKSWRIRK